MIQWIQENFTRAIITGVLLLLVIHSYSQKNELCFIDMDSVYTYSIIAIEGKQFADSLYNYHSNNLKLEVQLLQEDATYFMRYWGECCFCDLEIRAEEEKRVIALQQSLVREEEGLSGIRDTIDSYFNEFAKTIIVALLKQYVADNDLMSSMIIDSSDLGIHAFEGSSSFYLTSQLIREVNESAAVKEQLHRLKSWLEVEVEQIICRE